MLQIKFNYFVMIMLKSKFVPFQKTNDNTVLLSTYNRLILSTIDLISVLVIFKFCGIKSKFNNLTTVVQYFERTLVLGRPRVGKWHSLHICEVKNCTRDSNIIGFNTSSIKSNKTLKMIRILCSDQMLFGEKKTFAWKNSPKKSGLSSFKFSSVCFSSSSVY